LCTLPRPPLGQLASAAGRRPRCRTRCNVVTGRISENHRRIPLVGRCSLMARPPGRISPSSCAFEPRDHAKGWVVFAAATGPSRVRTCQVAISRSGPSRRINPCRSCGP
jgi:hypothetical protein